MNSERNIVTETKADSLNSYHLQSVLKNSTLRPEKDKTLNFTAILTKKLAKLINKNRKQL